MKRHIEIHSTRNSLRNTMLYHTLLHEIGHHIDYKQYSEEEWGYRTRKQKEDFAHRYAEETFKTLQKYCTVPFEPLIDIERMKQNGLDPTWFGVHQSESF